MKITKASCMYVILNPELNIVKIGISENPQKRLESLSYACGCALKLSYNTLPLKNARKNEAKCHEEFRDKRRIGEWFDVSVVSAVKYVKELEASIDIDIFVSKYISEKKSLVEIASEYKVTRQAVVKRLKTYGIYREKTKPIFAKLIKTESVVDIMHDTTSDGGHREIESKSLRRGIVSNMNEYQRVSKSAYMNNKTKEVVTIKYKNGNFRIIDDINDSDLT